MQLLIELPSREEQIAFNRKRWEEILADPELAQLPGKIECNAFGTVLVISPASGDHSRITRIIQRELENRLGGLALPECPVSTIDGVRAADVGWYSEARFERVRGQIAFEIAPEICVDVSAKSQRRGDNPVARIAGAALAKHTQNLYFEAGATEVWLCGLDGVMRFVTKDGRETNSSLCPHFPRAVR